MGSLNPVADFHDVCNAGIFSFGIKKYHDDRAFSDDNLHDEAVACSRGKPGFLQFNVHVGVMNQPVGIGVVNRPDAVVHDVACIG